MCPRCAKTPPKGWSFDMPVDRVVVVGENLNVGAKGLNTAGCNSRWGSWFTVTKWLVGWWWLTEMVGVNGANCHPRGGRGQPPSVSDGERGRQGAEAAPMTNVSCETYVSPLSVGKQCRQLPPENH